MKELEVLRSFINECKNDWATQPPKMVAQAISSNVSKYMYSFEQLLTPPTSKEVCKALSEYIQWDVIYIKHNKEFMMKIDNTSIVKVNMFGSVKFNTPLNARLITLIGRFYENEVNKNDI